MALQQKHRYTTCHDADCPRLACIAYKQGYEDGYAAGVAAAKEN
jgi:hypothetical protein